jgi:hypothetical protein
MKPNSSKINFLVFCLVILFLGCKKDNAVISNFENVQFPNESALSWDYPVKPGSEKWKTFQSGIEMVEACQIPKSVLTSLPTEELLLICLKFPLLFDIGAANFFSDGYAAYETNFNGIREFYQRKDAPAVIYSYYRQLNLENAVMYSSVFPGFRVSVVEYVLTTQAIISKYTAAQRKEIANELMSKLNIKKSQPENFPVTYQNSTYWALIRIIKSDADGKLSTGDSKLAGYFTGIGLPPENVIKQVEEIIRQYLTGK